LADDQGRPEKVIVVAETHSAALELLTELLEEAGCRVLAAGTADECLGLVQREQPHAVLVSDRLPGGQGTALCGKIKTQSGARIVLLTVMDTDEARRDAVKAGADACLVKPFSLADLVATTRV
jgi:DNA-binding response OmpR family regulator